MKADPYPRPLHQTEMAVIERILESGLPGSEILSLQLPHTKVTAPWAPDSPSIDLSTDGECAPAEIPDGVFPARSIVIDDGGHPIGSLLIWVESGMLSALEYAWYSDEPPTSLPDPAMIKFE